MRYILIKVVFKETLSFEDSRVRALTCINYKALNLITSSLHHSEALGALRALMAAMTSSEVMFYRLTSWLFVVMLTGFVVDVVTAAPSAAASFSSSFGNLFV